MNTHLFWETSRGTLGIDICMLKREATGAKKTWILGLLSQQLSLGLWAAGHSCFQAVIFLINLNPFKFLTFYFSTCIIYKNCIKGRENAFPFTHTQTRTNKQKTLLNLPRVSY